MKAKLEALGLEVSGEAGPEFATDIETGRALGAPGQSRRVQGRRPMTAMQERRNDPDVAGGGRPLRLSGGATSITARCGTTGSVATVKCFRVRNVY
jgi:hypothetical protein